MKTLYHTKIYHFVYALFQYNIWICFSEYTFKLYVKKP